MSAPVTFDPSEKIVLKIRRHWILFLGPTLQICFAAAIPFVLYFYFLFIGFISPEFAATNIPAFFGVWWLIVAWCALAVVWTDYYLDLWVLTDHRIISIQQIALFNRNISSWDIERVQEVTVRITNFIQTFFSYGEVLIQTAGPSDEYARAAGIPNPERVRVAILAQANHFDALKKIAHDQEQLLHTVSHEVKGYLTKDAAALASIAESDPSNATTPVRALATKALQETRQGVSAVMSMLESSDPKTGSLHITKSEFDLRKILHELVDEFKSAAETKHISLEADIGTTPCVIAGDEVKIRELVFRNLVDNAIRYTKEGSVRITLAKAVASVVCTVSDTGVGISTHDMKNLFTEGGKGERSTDTNPDSTGFGLAAAKRIVDVHDGTIIASSRADGRGTSFIVTLPVGQ